MTLKTLPAFEWEEIRAMAVKLFDRDWRFIVEAIYQINSITSLDSFQREVLEHLQVVAPADQGTFFLYSTDGDFRPIGTPVVVGDPAKYMDLFMNGSYNNDPYFTGMVSLGQRNRVFRDSDILPEEYRIRTRLYREVYARQGIHYGLRAFLICNNSLEGNISIFNTKERGEFSDKAVEILAILEPHIALKLWMLRHPDRTQIQKPPIDATTLISYGLTNRELEILAAVMQGTSDRDIADRLCISFSTFKKHLYNIYRKLNVNSRIQLYNTVKAAGNDTIDGMRLR